MRLTLILALFLCTTWLGAQVPTTCFEIESILVDACAEGSNCGSASAPACQCEGKNEMFTFVVGPDDLDVTDMDISWANGGNSYLGVCQNATTTGIIEDINATIVNCGHLIEPVNNILPSGADVLMITSTDLCTFANSFAGLSDTLVVIFQCPGNYFGHFANFGTNGNTARTLTVDFGPGCEDEVTYYKDQLIDINGLPAAMDGAGVNFTWSGTDTYFNNGCNAPVEQETFSAGGDVVACPGETVQLGAQAGDTFTDIEWTGGTGSFSDASLLDPIYTLGAGDGQEVVLTFSAVGCNGPISDEVLVTDLSGQLTGITTDGPSAICNGEQVTLIAEGTGVLFEWSTGVFAPSITVDEADDYSVTITNACGEFTEEITIDVALPPSISLVSVAEVDICEGSSVTLEAEASGGEIVWSTAETGPSIEVGVEDEYTATVTNGCGTQSVSVDVDVIQLPAVSISPSGQAFICEEGEVVLTATGQGEFQWSGGTTGASLTVSQTGTISVTATNQCGTATDAIDILQGGSLPIASIGFDDDLVFCEGETIELTASGGDTYQWNGEDGPATLIVDQGGDYILMAINECGTDVAQVTVVQAESPSLLIDGGLNHAICNGESAEVSVMGAGTIMWDDGLVADIRSFSEPGSFEVTSTATCGELSETVQIVIQDIDARLDADPIIGEAPLEVNFFDETVNGLGTSWTFGDGGSAVGTLVMHTYEDKGTYEAELSVSSSLGCTDTQRVIIEVGACPFVLFIPSAFTPNADLLNDQLSVEGNCIDRFDWKMYDRWGRQLFTTSDPGFVWNGADKNGYAVLNGEYSYIITVLDVEGQTHRYIGTISVIR